MARRKKFVKRKTRRTVISRDCYFCSSGSVPSYKDISVLGRFITDRGKLISKSKTGTCSKHQRRLAKSIKQARYLALLPFVVRPS